MMTRMTFNLYRMNMEDSCCGNSTRTHSKFTTAIDLSDYDEDALEDAGRGYCDSGSVYDA